MKKIGIVGSRRRNSYSDFEKCLNTFLKLKEEFGEEIMIVSGGCPKGADSFAEKIAKSYQIPILIFYAQWEKYGKPAGPIRNKKIAEWSDILIALPADDRTGGVESAILEAGKLGKKVILL